MITQRQASPTTDIVEQKYYSRLAKVIAKCVCKPCNTGWMSRIEKLAGEYLKPMINGDDCALDAQAQKVISTWATLKAMVGHYFYDIREDLPHEAPAPLAEDWRKYFYESFFPPHGWWVLLGSYEGLYPACFKQRTVATRLMNFPPSSLEQGIVMTMIAGRLAVKVFAVRDGRPRYAGANMLLRIWPRSPVILHWPPTELAPVLRTVRFLIDHAATTVVLYSRS